MKKHIKILIFSLIFALLLSFISYMGPFSSIDNFITDNLYSRLRNTNKDIIMICIDEETLNEYGSFTSWSRDKIADVVDYLYSSDEYKPIVVGLDITFQGDGDNEIDTKLADACKGDKNIVVSAPIIFKGKVEKIDDRTINYDALNIDFVEYPYDSLNENVISGYTNTFLSNDSISRCSMGGFKYNGKEINSFSYEIASIYAKEKNINIPPINFDKEGLYRFFYAGKEKQYSHISLKNVADQKIPVSEFNNKIVLIGAYATGMQDAYFVTNDIGGTMNGVEIHANIIQSLLDGATARNIDRLVYSIVIFIIAFIACFFALFLNSFIVSIVISILSVAAHILFGFLASKTGLLIPQLYVIVLFVCLLLYSIISRFINEFKRRKHITQVFSRYMDPKVVNTLAKDEHNTFNSSGEKRDVSILFVDIRGFTKMSESMEPEEVVAILNDYLELVTNCIFKHGGMLDKFIGDAAMAIFNAPVNQKDYIYESVACAYDIAKGSEELSKKLFDKYGKTVSYGVGVHCGKAVIGNIGCKTRLDYTAIGDTVNTASRIEGKAQKGEVLISKEVRDALFGRIEVEDAGFVELKGKAQPINIFRLIEITKGKNDWQSL